MVFFFFFFFFQAEDGIRDGTVNGVQTCALPISYEVEHLEGILERAPDFAAALAEKGMKADKFLAAIRALTFPEKLALVDHAMQTQGPAASVATSQEP